MLTISPARKEEASKMEKLVKEFLKKGGKITVAKPGKHVKTFKR